MRGLSFEYSVHAIKIPALEAVTSGWAADLLLMSFQIFSKWAEIELYLQDSALWSLPGHVYK